MFASRRLALVTSIAVLSVGAVAASQVGAEPAPTPAPQPAVVPVDAAARPSLAQVSGAAVTAVGDPVVDAGEIDLQIDPPMGPQIDQEVDTSWMEESNADSTELAAYLTSLGITNTLHTEDDGWLWVEWNYEDPAAQTAVEDYYWNKFPTPQEEIDQINAENDELVAYLRAHGIEVTVSTDRHGIESAEWNYDDPAAQIAVEDYYWEKYPIPQEQIDEMNAETQALVDFLVSKGFTASVTVDRHGIATPNFEYTDDIGEAMAEYYGSTSPEEDGPIVFADADDTEPAAGTSGLPAEFR